VYDFLLVVFYRPGVEPAWGSTGTGAQPAWGSTIKQHTTNWVIGHVLPRFVNRPRHSTVAPPYILISTVFWLLRNDTKHVLSWPV